MYTRRVARPRALRPRHSVENQWDLLSALDIPAPDRATNAVEMTVAPDAAARVASRLVRAGVTADDRLVVVHVSAGNPFRRWPIAAFAALITLLVSKDSRRRIIVSSGPSEGQAAGRVIGQARALLGTADRERVVSCGDFSLD